MIIDDPDSFRAWLTATLEPRCDADPAALAKYVLALVRKDRPIPELRTCMMEQLDVFLQTETNDFVDLLFKTLETQVFEVKAPIKADPLPIVNAVLPDPAATKLPESFPTQPPVQVAVPAVEPVATGVLPLAYQTANGSSSARERREEPKTTRKSETDVEKEKPARGRGRSMRSRSRSWERTRRSRSRERETRRERDRSRPWRNKSPPRSRQPYERGERRRTWSRSKSPVIAPRLKSRSRSPRSPTYNRRGGRYRNRSPPIRISPGSRSRSRSAERKKEKEPVGTPTQDSNHGDVDMRLTTTSQSIQSVVCTKTTPPSLLSQHKHRCRDFDEKGYCMRGDLCPFDHGNDPVVLEDVALGGVLTFGPNHPPPNHQAGPPMGNIPPPHQPPALPLGDRPPIMRPRHPMHMNMHIGQMRGPPPANMEYNPDAPSMEPRAMMWGNQRFRGPMRGGPMRGMNRMAPYQIGPQSGGPMHNNQRELISVPVSDQQNYHMRQQQALHNPQFRGGNNNYDSKDSALKKRMNYDVFGRLGPRQKNPQNCSLELKKIPRGLNNITHLNNHFTKFGKIVNIQVSYEGDPEAAIVTFSSHAEANAAYRSTEAVLNNRFIKVFWHNVTNEQVKQVQENLPPIRQSIKDRLGAVPGVNKEEEEANLNLKPEDEGLEKVVLSGNVLTKTLYIPTSVKKQEGNEVVAPTLDSITTKANNLAAIKNSQDILEAKVTLKKMQLEKQKEAIKLSVDLRKRKQELLAKQLGQQRLLIGRLEKLEAGEQRDSLMGTIKTLQESIENIKKENESSNQGAAKNNAAMLLANKQAHAAKLKTALVNKSKEEAQREILDLELDLITKQQEGGDTSELQLKVAELKMEAQSLGIPGVSGVTPRMPRGRGMRMRGSFRGGSRGRGVGSYSQAQAHSSVDHRPTKVLVSGYENDEKAEVIQHFNQYGEIVDYMCDDATPSVILNYKSRKEAESALIKGRNFQDRLLSITWCNQPGQRNPRNMTTSVLMQHSMSQRNLLRNTSQTEEGQLLEEGEENLEDEEEVNDNIDLFNEDVLLQDDEEDEDDDEVKTWRR